MVKLREAGVVPDILASWAMVFLIVILYLLISSIIIAVLIIAIINILIP